MSRSTRWLLLAAATIAVGYFAWRHDVFSSSAGRQFTDAERAQSKTNLKQIGRALLQYHDKYDCYPPAYVLGPDDKPWHSWRTLILPYLGEQELYSQYRFDEPWDGPHNRELQAKRPAVYASPLQTSKSDRVVTYVGVVSRRSMWPATLSVRIPEVTDGTSNTIQLLEYVGCDVVWSEPRDLRERELKHAIWDSDIDRKSGVAGFFALFCDGTVRWMTRGIGRGMLVGLMSPKCQQWTMPDDRWPEGLLPDDANEITELPPPKPLDQYPGTRVHCTPDTTLDPALSTLYCATVQLAWDEIRAKPGTPVKVLNPTPASNSLNAHPFPPKSLAEECYFVGHSTLDDKATAALFNRLREKFGGATAQPLPAPRDMPGYRVLAYLEKSMPFVDPLERMATPLQFESRSSRHAIKSFGSPEHLSGKGDADVYHTVVTVNDYLSDNDFVIQLRTESAQTDDIFLAKVAPAETLQATWDEVAARLITPRAPKVVAKLRQKDRLEIPILSFGVAATIPELIGLEVEFRGAPALPILEAKQTIRFRLDENGAELVSDMQMLFGSFDGDVVVDINQPRRLVFDKPFLLALRERNAESPYFLAWIGNADLMEGAK